MKISDFTPVITALIGLLCSYITAKLTTKREFKKLVSQQNHEIKLNAIDAFAKMQNAVNAYTTTPIPKYQREALSAIGGFTPYASEKMLTIIESLKNSINANQSAIASDFLNRLSSEWLSENPAQKNIKG